MLALVGSSSASGESAKEVGAEAPSRDGAKLDVELSFLKRFYRRWLKRSVHRLHFILVALNDLRRKAMNTFWRIQTGADRLA